MLRVHAETTSRFAPHKFLNPLFQRNMDLHVCTLTLKHSYTLHACTFESLNQLLSNLWLWKRWMLYCPLFKRLPIDPLLVRHTRRLMPRPPCWWAVRVQCTNAASPKMHTSLHNARHTVIHVYTYENAQWNCPPVRRIQDFSDDDVRWNGSIRGGFNSFRGIDDCHITCIWFSCPQSAVFTCHSDNHWANISFKKK